MKLTGCIIVGTVYVIPAIDGDVGWYKTTQVAPAGGRFLSALHVKLTSMILRSDLRFFERPTDTTDQDARAHVDLSDGGRLQTVGHWDKTRQLVHNPRQVHRTSSLDSVQAYLHDYN